MSEINQKIILTPSVILPLNESENSVPNICVGGIKQLHGGTFVYVLNLVNPWGSTLLLNHLRLPAHVIPCNYQCTFSFGKLTN
jgi:hypothetical protein